MRPIPDSVLLAFKRRPPMAPEVVTEIIDALLELRGAVRGVVSWRYDPAHEALFEANECPHCGKNNAAPFDTIRALLPEEPS